MKDERLQADGRAFRSSLDSPVLDAIQSGTLRSVYRGVPFFKSPLDIGLYIQLLSRLKPATVIEIGTKSGGSALWFADMLAADGARGAVVVSVDIAPEVAFEDGRIRFLIGDANRLWECLPPAMLADLPHPWLIVEDSSHMYAETKATLEYFDPYTEVGDYIVVEDGVVGQLTDPHYRTYDDGPSRAIADFLLSRTSRYTIDTDLCDHYGYNATYNPNGWLRRR